MTTPFEKFLVDAAEQMDMTGNLYVAAGPDGPEVVKSSAYIPVSYEHLIDAGLMTEEEARARGWTPRPRPRIPWWRRLRWRVQAWRMTAGRKVGGWIAGERLYNDDEDY